VLLPPPACAGLLDQPMPASAPPPAHGPPWRWGGLRVGELPLGLSVGSAACAPLALVGLLGCRLNLPAALRYGAQILATAISLSVGVGRHRCANLLLARLPLVAITAVDHFFHFMDGLDGLVARLPQSAVVFAVAGSARSVLASGPPGGGPAGLLMLELEPAPAVHGDCGQHLLGWGGVFAGVVLQAPGFADGLALLLVAVRLLGRMP